MNPHEHPELDAFLAARRRPSTPDLRRGRVHHVDMEARLSLRATQPDPFQAFAVAVVVGQELRGRVTKPVPSGAFVEVAEGVEGLVPQPGFGEAGDEVVVVVTGIDRKWRRPALIGRG